MIYTYGVYSTDYSLPHLLPFNVVKLNLQKVYRAILVYLLCYRYYLPLRVKVLYEKDMRRKYTPSGDTESQEVPYMPITVYIVYT